MSKGGPLRPPRRTRQQQWTSLRSHLRTTWPWLVPVAHAVLRAQRSVMIGMPAAISGYRARNRDPKQIISTWPAAPPPIGPDVAVFIHFDPDGRVRPRVRRYLLALREAGLSVLFASNSGHLEPQDEAALRGLCDGYLLRRNVGYDFGAMREALTYWRLPLADTRCVLLVNDSLIGPFGPLRPLLDRIDFATADVWGATDSLQRGHHLQSFFLAVGAAALRHPAWVSFWGDVRPAKAKDWVIGRYEIGLTQRLMAAGLRGRALFPYQFLLERLRADEVRTPAHAAQRAYSELLLSRGHILNPSLALWRELLAAGFPFIKRDLLTRNAAKIIDIDEWPIAAGVRRDADWS